MTIYAPEVHYLVVRRVSTVRRSIQALEEGEEQRLLSIESLIPK
jgi:hypothetical protein